METVKAKPNQTVYDIAIEQYGTCEAIGEIMVNNPGLTNEAAALTALGIEAVGETDFYLDVALGPYSDILIDTASALMRGTVTKEITQDITTFGL